MSSAKYLILLKHSLPDVVKDIPAREWHLSEAGRVRAFELVKKLIRYQPEIIISSVEPKALETAEIIAASLELDFQVIEGLHEHDRSGSPYYSNAEFQNLVQEFFDKPNELVFGNESAKSALGRFRRAVDFILNSYGDKNIAIVTHGTVISLFVAWLTGSSGYDLWQELGLPSFVVLDIQSKSLIHTENLGEYPLT